MGIYTQQVDNPSHWIYHSKTTGEMVSGYFKSSLVHLIRKIEISEIIPKGQSIVGKKPESDEQSKNGQLKNSVMLLRNKKRLHGIEVKGFELRSNRFLQTHMSSPFLLQFKIL